MASLKHIQVMAHIFDRTEYLTLTVQSRKTFDVDRCPEHKDLLSFADTFTADL